MKFLTNFLCAGIMLSAVTASAAILATEDFTYADGALVPNGTWVNHSGTPGTLTVASGAAVVTENSGSEDANMAFASQSSGVLTASFDITVTAPGALAGGDYEYFAHFYPTDNGFNFRARTDIVPPNGAGDYSIGISSGSSTAELSLPVDFSYGVVVPVSISFDIDAGTASLTAGGSTVNTTAIFAGEVLNGFALRQSNSSSDETIVVDNIVISNNSAIPEPGSAILALLGVTLAGAATMRSRLG